MIRYEREARRPYDAWLWKIQLRDRGYVDLGRTDPRDVVLLCEKPALAAVALRWDHRSGRFGAIPTPGGAA